MPSRSSLRLVVVIAVAALAGAAALVHRSAADLRSIRNESVFYRLLATYQHGDEFIDFDIVVGCAVRVTRWGDRSSSYDAFRDPVAYVKATRDGGALLQMVPDACSGETTENGAVPADFLPGAVWFDDATDLSLGVAYVTEDAYENPLSKLQFLGASVWPATRDDYVALESIAAQNLIDPRPLFTLLPLPDLEEVRLHLGDSRALAKLRRDLGCRAITRFRLSDPDERAVVRKYWPESRPRYWMASEEDLERINQEIRLYSEMQVDDHRISDYFRLNYYVGKGFPTRSQGGRFRSQHRPSDKLPSTVFPLRSDEGIPWITRDYLTAETLYREINTDGGAQQGVAYCYAGIGGHGLGVPAYLNDSFETRINGEFIYGEESDGRIARYRPYPFFERDEYFYLQDEFGLN